MYRREGRVAAVAAQESPVSDLLPTKNNTNGRVTASQQEFDFGSASLALQIQLFFFYNAKEQSEFSFCCLLFAVFVSSTAVDAALRLSNCDATHFSCLTRRSHLLVCVLEKRRRADVVFSGSTAPEMEEVHAESSSSRSVALIVQLPKAEDLPPTYDEATFQNNNFCSGSYSKTKLINDHLKEELSPPPPNYEDALGNLNLKVSIDSKNF